MQSSLDDILPTTLENMDYLNLKICRHMKKEVLSTLVFILLIFMSATSLRGQEIWTSAGMKVKMVKGLSGHIEGEYRTLDKLAGTERWSAAAGLDYKVLSWLKLSTEYKFIHCHKGEEETKKGNIISAYWNPRHRITLAVTGSYTVNRFTFSLRECYQYTHHMEQSVRKWDGDDGTPKDDELIEAKDKHSLRSRLKIDYKIRNSRFTPFVSCELYNSLTSRLAYEKVRCTIGTDCKLSKRNTLSLFYRYVNTSDRDDNDSHIIGIGYEYKL